VTHDQTEAMTLADRIVLLDKGEVQQIGAPLELYHRPANRFVAGFLGSPGMNLIQGTVTDAGGFQGQGVLLAPGSLEKPPRPGPAVLGVRPEGVVLAPADSGLRVDAQLAVAAVEPLGHETLVALESGQGQSVLLRTSAGSPLPVSGNRVPVHFDRRSLHWFEAGEHGRRM
jgi:ABC-type sugar transport system ATPase subunit